MWINPNDVQFVLVRNGEDSEMLLDLMKRAMMFYAQEAQLPLYRRDGTYYLPALNETRGDILWAIENEEFLALMDHDQYLATCRLVSDYKRGKSLLTRFSVHPKLYKTNIAEIFLDRVIAYARKQGLQELYVYIAQSHKPLMDLFKSRNFMLYSINDGHPYPKVCLIKDLQRGLF